MPIYNKVVHPREYYFDLYDGAEKLKFRKNKETGLLSCTIDLTDAVKDDIPQGGDKLIFYYDGYPSKSINGDIIATLEVPMTMGQERVVACNVPKKVNIRGNFSYVLNSNIDKVKITFTLPAEQESSRIDFINNETEYETTDIAAEIKAEKKALRKKYTIIEIPTEIIDEYSLKPTDFFEKNKKSEEKKLDNKPKEKTSEEILAEAAKKAEEEAKEKERLAIEERKKAERLEYERQQQEILDHQKKLEETIETITNTDIKRYEKEYLNDYMITEYADEKIEEETENHYINPISNPDLADEFGRTLLMKAAQEGNDWQIKALLKANANVNLKDKDGWTALMYAVRYQENLNCVELLIDAGAEVKAKNNFGMSSLILASNYNNNPEILKLLLSYYTPTDKDVLKSFILVLTENSATEYMQIIKANLFLDMSVPLNSFYEGKTPIMYAAESGSSTKVIKLLLDNNSITSIRSTEGKTAFDYAKENHKLKHDNIYWSLNNK